MIDKDGKETVEPMSVEPMKKDAALNIRMRLALRLQSTRAAGRVAPRVNKVP